MRKQTAATSRRRGNGRRGSGPRGVKASPGVAGAAPEPAGAATLTEGLDRLDQERAASLADEGGSAGAEVEAQPPQPATVARSAAGKLRVAAS